MMPLMKICNAALYSCGWGESNSDKCNSRVARWVEPKALFLAKSLVLGLRKARISSCSTFVVGKV